jgi:hypothetical protein
MRQSCNHKKGGAGEEPCLKTRQKFIVVCFSLGVLLPQLQIDIVDFDISSTRTREVRDEAAVFCLDNSLFDHGAHVCHVGAELDAVGVVLGHLKEQLP